GETEPAAVAISGEAERRQLTVMFCDLVGSTPLSARYDPEDLREIVGAYHRCVADTVARYAGFVAKYMGDGVLIYFGYPEAHEDDAERAVRAGLAVIDAVGGLATPEPLNVRLGVASGLVVVGDLIGAGAAQERGVGRGGLCWSRGSRGSANRALVRPCRSASRARRTHGCAISARPTTRTARSTRSSSSSNAPLGLRATTRSRKGSASCEHCSGL